MREPCQHCDRLVLAHKFLQLQKPRPELHQYMHVAGMNKALKINPDHRLPYRPIITTFSGYVGCRQGRDCGWFVIVEAKGVGIAGARGGEAGFVVPPSQLLWRLRLPSITVFI